MTWRQAALPGWSLVALAVGAADPPRIYALSEGGEIYRLDEASTSSAD